MKTTGIVRRIDGVGRVVLPKELRSVMGIKSSDPLEICVEKDKIILQKYETNSACIVTGEISNRNIDFIDGKITLSKNGAEILQKELQTIFNEEIDYK